MANRNRLEIPKEGFNYRNALKKNIGIYPVCDGADLTGANLSGVHPFGANYSGGIFTGANFSRSTLVAADFSRATLVGADFSEANLSGVDFTEANLSGANLSGASLFEAKLFKANLSGANLSGASLNRADLLEADISGANLIDANLSEANFLEANLSGSDLTNALLTGALCIQTNFENATLENAKIYGISVWNIKSEGLKQNNLVITKGNEPKITVDNIEVAQFIYLILNNEKIRDVIGTIAKKGVLILGRFTDERKKILDAIRNKLREFDFVPIMFDFEKVSSRDFTETIKILAGLSRFVIADITNPKSAPLELQATVPDYKIPFLTIIQEGEMPFSMFSDLQKYNWVLPTMSYGSETALLQGFKKGIIDKALDADRRLYEEKQVPPPNIMNIEDFED
ncbi:MAG: pentapeptide repeat-containing protein [Bacteroidia bacterium]|nr:pentapeptide repeat-containing protein [Bacteroidia bacterium]